MTADEALRQAREALPYVKAGKRSMGPPGYLNPVQRLADGFQVLDGLLSHGGEMPGEWAKENKSGGEST
jgi:hypothetical protein